MDEKVCCYCGGPLNCAYNSQREIYFLACGKIRGKALEIDIADPYSYLHFRLSWHLEKHRIMFEYNYRFVNQSTHTDTKYLDFPNQTQIPKYWENVMNKIKSTFRSSNRYVLFE
ncbi:MAG: hypothetical protein ACW99F_07335 [Candidatus Hodarchaeales archaeon]